MSGQGHHRSLASALPMATHPLAPDLQPVVPTLAAIRAAGPGKFDRAAQPHLFDRIDWIEPLQRLCMAEKPAHVLSAYHGAQEAWLFLADSGERHRSAIANWYSFAFRPVFVGEPDRETQQLLLEQIARTLATDVAQVDLYPILADDGTLDTLLAAFRRAGWLAVARPMGMNHFLRLDGRDFAAYWADRPGKLRSTVKRKAKAGQLSYDIHHALADALWDDYVAVYRRSWKPEEPGLDFLRALAAHEGEAGTLRLGFARDHGTPVATQLWTVENGTALIHKLAHDQGAVDSSPGTMLSHHMFRAAIDGDRVDLIDYGTGDNPHKTEWMEEQRPLHRIDAFNPRFASSWLPAARAAISSLRG